MAEITRNLLLIFEHPRHPSIEIGTQFYCPNIPNQHLPSVARGLWVVKGYFYGLF